MSPKLCKEKHKWPSPNKGNYHKDREGSAVPPAKRKAKRRAQRKAARR